MAVLLQITLLFLSLYFSSSFVLHAKSQHRFAPLNARVKKQTEPVDDTPSFIVGENVPEEIKKQNAIYDMILVERFSAAEKTDFGLFLPKVEGKDQKHVGKVLSVPTTYGLESEQGRVQTVEEIAPYKVGDMVYIQDPWGIGELAQSSILTFFLFIHFLVSQLQYLFKCIYVN